MPNRSIASAVSLLLVGSAQCERCTEGEPPEAATLTLSFSRVKMFDFDWAEVEGADYYHLLERPAPSEPFVTIEEELLEEGISVEVPLHLRYEASYVLRSCNDTGCTDSAPVGAVGTLAEAIGYFKASSTDAGSPAPSSAPSSTSPPTLSRTAFARSWERLPSAATWARPSRTMARPPSRCGTRPESPRCSRMMAHRRAHPEDADERTELYERHEDDLPSLGQEIEEARTRLRAELRATLLRVRARLAGE